MGEWQFLLTLPTSGPLAPKALCKGAILFKADDLGGTFSDEKKYEFELYIWNIAEKSAPAEPIEELGPKPAPGVLETPPITDEGPTEEPAQESAPETAKPEEVEEAPDPDATAQPARSEDHSGGQPVEPLETPSDVSDSDQ